jgi:hypothetical protein
MYEVSWGRRSTVSITVRTAWDALRLLKRFERTTYLDATVRLCGSGRPLAMSQLASLAAEEEAAAPDFGRRSGETEAT